MDYFVNSDDLKKLNIPYLRYGSNDFIELLFKHLNERGFCMILYEINPHHGHWVCVLGKNKGHRNLEFFDSYGMKTDDELKHATYSNLMVHGVKLLHDLFENTDSIIEYNGKRLQRMSKNINTCGKWCLLRIYVMIHFPEHGGTLTQFLKFVKKNKITDAVLGQMNVDDFIY
jgi:hypothetical protein